MVDCREQRLRHYQYVLKPPILHSAFLFLSRCRASRNRTAWLRSATSSVGRAPASLPQTMASRPCARERQGRGKRESSSQQRPTPRQCAIFFLSPRIYLHSANVCLNFAEFAPEHPGGERILQRFAGKNATKAFWKYHSENVLKKHAEKHKIGTVAEAPKL